MFEEILQKAYSDLVGRDGFSPSDWQRIEVALKIFEKLPSLIEQELPTLKVFEKGRSDIVTSLDLAVESYLLNELSSAFPGDQILSEESGWLGNAGELLHVIDPIDLTRNVPRGQQFLTLYCLRKRGEPLISIIMAFRPFYCYLGINGVGVFSLNQLSGPCCLISERQDNGRCQAGALKEDSHDLRFVVVHNFRVQRHSVDVDYYLGSSRSFILGVLERDIDCCCITLDEIGRQWGFFAWDYLPFLDLVHIFGNARTIYLPNGRPDIGEDGRMVVGDQPLEGFYIFLDEKKDPSLRFLSELNAE